MMFRGKRYRIYSDKEQKVLMEKHSGNSRFVYNKLSEIKLLRSKKFRMSILNLNL